MATTTNTQPGPDATGHLDEPYLAAFDAVLRELDNQLT
jgi:hypothetical protein